MGAEHKVGTILGVVLIVALAFVSSYGCSTVEEEKTERLNIIAQYGDADAVGDYVIDNAP